MEISLEEYGKLSDRIADLMHENERLRKIVFATQSWISVKDRLPDDDGEVVLACYQPRKPNYVFFAYFNGNGSWALYQPTEDGVLYSHPVKVSHWMPLPEPPEVEDGNGE